MKNLGVMATFGSKKEFISTFIALKKLGIRRMEAASYQEIEGLDEILDLPSRPLEFSIIGLVGGLTGLFGGLAMQWYANVISAPLNIGGRPLNSWPAFIPVMFVLTILCSALFLTAAFIIKLRLPWLSHPLFKTSLNLSKEEFAILVYSKDPLYESLINKKWLEQFKPNRIEEIPWS
ncbi:MAG: DUF3341 domain-containing protein [Bdellovibrio sp.]